LALEPGQKIAYVFDFGDEWRVELTVARVDADDGGVYPRLLESIGKAPAQYPALEEDVA
jgi:Plasmid pRiA4b ORF-3-like protein